MQFADGTFFHVPGDADGKVQEDATGGIDCLKLMRGESNPEPVDFVGDADALDSRNLDADTRQQIIPEHSRINFFQVVRAGMITLGGLLERATVREVRHLRLAEPGGGDRIELGQILRAERVGGQSRGREQEILAGGLIQFPGLFQSRVALEGPERRGGLRPTHPVDRATGKAPARQLHLRLQPVGHRAEILRRDGRRRLGGGFYLGGLSGGVLRRGGGFRVAVGAQLPGGAEGEPQAEKKGGTGRLHRR